MNFLSRLSILKRMNWIMVGATALLLVIGVLFIYSSRWVSEEEYDSVFFLKQIVWIVVGIGCYLGFTVWDYRKLGKWAWWVYIVCLLMLVLVMIPSIGIARHGARRWLVFPGMRIQPSELTKVAVIILLARILSLPAMDWHAAKPYILVGAVVMVPFLIIAAQPDLGTAMVLLPTAFVMLFAGGVSLRVLGFVVLAGLLVVGLVLGVLILPGKMGMDAQAQESLYRHIGLKKHWRTRILVTLGVIDDTRGEGYNKRQCMIAVGSGGKWGKGFTKGTQNVLGFVPRTVAPTDFIYSVIAEEKGFLGSVVVLFLFGTVIVTGFVAALVARDKMGRMLCVGVATMIFCHVFVNIAMTVGLLPITGLPLPFLSYGGSFMVVMMSSLGIVQSVFVRARRAQVF